MTDVYVLSSYDEYIYFLEHTARSSSSQIDRNVIVVLNCEALAKFLQSSASPLGSSEKLLIVLPFPRSGGVIDRINIVAERSYFRRNWETLLRSVELGGLVNLFVYANFMNGPTASLISYLRSIEGIDMRVKFSPTLAHVNTSPPLRVSLRQFLSLLRSRIVYGPYMRLVDIGHKVILSISGGAFDDIEFEKQLVSHVPKRSIKLYDLPEGMRKVVFACQPLLKNDRVTVGSYSKFFETLCLVLSDLGVDVVFKLHPGELETDYKDLGAPLIDGEIPFQHLDLSGVLAVLTFSSGAAVGLSKPVISCTNLLEFRSLKDKREIDRLFDVRLANAGQTAASRPTSWRGFLDDIKKAIDP